VYLSLSGLWTYTTSWDTTKVAIRRANQVWALDTTYIPMARGFVRLTAVVDVASRMVLAHKVAVTLEAIHAKEVVEQAFARYGTPEIVNTDHGAPRVDHRGFAFVASDARRRGHTWTPPTLHRFNPPAVSLSLGVKLFKQAEPLLFGQHLLQSTRAVVFDMSAVGIFPGQRTATYLWTRLWWCPKTLLPLPRNASGFSDFLESPAKTPLSGQVKASVAQSRRSTGLSRATVASVERFSRDAEG
jgi:hypothetical protein